jgi:hypothetical protein
MYYITALPLTMRPFRATPMSPARVRRVLYLLRDERICIAEPRVSLDAVGVGAEAWAEIEAEVGVGVGVGVEVEVEVGVGVGVEVEVEAAAAVVVAAAATEAEAVEAAAAVAAAVIAVAAVASVVVVVATAPLHTSTRLARSCTKASLKSPDRTCNGVMVVCISISMV